MDDATCANLPPRVLIVDDEASIRFALQKYFTSSGFAVDTAQELEEAEALILYRSYAVVVADLRLTDVRALEGLELVSFIRQVSPRTRTILLTSYGSPEIEAEARRLGVDAFLHKPEPLPRVADLVHRLLGARP
jgi:two-component system response regulator PilR (NtrC family)